MRTSRIFVEQPLSEGASIALDADASSYVNRVLRLRPGAPLRLFNGAGGEYESRITAAGANRVTVEPLRFLATDRESPLSLRLVLGVSRAERMDFAIQKGVELGARAIVPVTTERSVVRLDPARAARRAAHWRRIIIGACQQSGRTRIPDLTPVGSFEPWLAEHPAAGLELLLDPCAGTTLTAVRYQSGPVTLLVGPEGGLTADEAGAAIRAGFVAVRLGPRTLRAETAAVAGLTAIQARWGDLK